MVAHTPHTETTRIVTVPTNPVSPEPRGAGLCRNAGYLAGHEDSIASTDGLRHGGM